MLPHYKGAALFAPFFHEQGHEVEVVDTLDVYLDETRMHALDLIVPEALEIMKRGMLWASK